MMPTFLPSNNADDENDDDIIYSVQKEEERAIIKRNELATVPASWGEGIKRSFMSMPTTTTHIDNDEESFPYDLADPNTNRQTNEEDDDENSNGYHDSKSMPKSEKHNNDKDGSDIQWNYHLAKLRSQSTDHFYSGISDTNYSLTIKSITDSDSIDQLDGVNKNQTFAGKTVKDGKPTKTSLQKRIRKPSRQEITTTADVLASAEDIEMRELKSKRKSNSSNHSSLIISSSNLSASEIDILSVSDVTQLIDITIDSITDCVERRFSHDLVCTNCGDIVISVNPWKPLEFYTYKYFNGYTEKSISEAPHLFAVSARAYQNIRRQEQDQVIVVSGESGSGKSEAVKLLVRHLMFVAGSEDATLLERIIQVNHLLESFGNAKTKLNNNSSRFTKVLALGVDIHGQIISSRVADYMLETSRLVHYDQRERSFHSFYSLLVGAPDKRLLETLYIGDQDVFKITGDLSGATEIEKKLFSAIFNMQQDVFKLFKFTENEIKDIYMILAAILHLGNVEFQDSSNESVVITDESLVHKVAFLLKVDVTRLIKALIERTGRMGRDQKSLFEIKLPQRRSGPDLASQFRTPSRGKTLEDGFLGVSGNSFKEDVESFVTDEIINLPKSKQQAELERDALIMSLYSRLFGWLVRKSNDSLNSYKKCTHIRILDIQGFENLNENRFDQMCINVLNEQVHNFLNKKSFEKKGSPYIQEGVDIEDFETEGVCNDAVFHLFTEKTSGLLTVVDEATKNTDSTNNDLVASLVSSFGNGGILVPSVSSSVEFMIRHLPGEVTYNASSFLESNRDNLSETMKECFIESKSLLIKDLFTIPESATRSISMTGFDFQGSADHSLTIPKRISDISLSESINSSRTVELQEKFGNNFPKFQNAGLETRNTQVKFFNNSMDELRNLMEKAHLHSIRCIKPNDWQLAGEFSRERVKAQLTYNGIKEIAKIRTLDYAVEMLKGSFTKKYKALVEPSSKTDLFQDILQASGADDSQYKVGVTKIFMSDFVKKELDSKVTQIKKRMEELMRYEAMKKLIEEQIVKEESKDVNTQRYRKEDVLRKAKELALNLESAEVPRTQYVPMLPIEEIRDSVSNMADSVYAKLSGTQKTDISSEQELSDDDDDDDGADMFINQLSGKTTIESWDMAMEITEEEEKKDVHEQPTLMVVKFIVYIILFIVILCAFVMQKVSFLLLTTGLKVNSTGKDVPTTKHIKDIKSAFFLLLITALCIPYALSWVISVGRLCFGNFQSPSIWTWLWVLLMETLHSIGLNLLVFRILPNLDVYRSTMILSATAMLPSILKVTMASSDSVPRATQFLCWQIRLGNRTSTILGYVLDVVATLGQISVIPLTILLSYFPDVNTDYQWTSQNVHILEIVGTFILVSFAHWENFADGKFIVKLGTHNAFKNAVLKVRFELQEARHYPHLITYLWKIGITLLMGYLFNEDMSFDYADAVAHLSDKKFPIGVKAISPCIAMIISGFVTFYLSFFACMFQMQVISLAIPALLAAPVTFAIFCLNDKYRFLEVLEDNDVFHGLGNHFEFPGYSHNLLFGLAWWLSLVILSRHLWFPRKERVAGMARLFIKENYCGVLTVESIVLNLIRNSCKVCEFVKLSPEGDTTAIYYELERNQIEDKKKDKETKKKEKEEDIEGGIEEKKEGEDGEDSDPRTPMLYACATMWHENRKEMIQLLKSIHRIDLDQYIRKLANEGFKEYDPDYYNFEAHIFFDDAMELDDFDKQVVNKYVKELVSCMDVACSSVHGKPMKTHHPVKILTPYGGQLIWQLPGENLLFVHMKDITFIRNRKRWSQVMYMYYLLSYRKIMVENLQYLENMKKKNAEGGGKGIDIQRLNQILGEKASVKLANTFLLALDGDTDFSPGAIKILLDKMGDGKVGAACGRIHPIGNGPLVWYQKFEYAIGHWLQKAAEHVFGCVLCSPGCFSLFRASALMDKNIMKRYTTEPMEATHHLQYDQGEDRWLCTLLLQQGYRIVYAAAADAWTYAPEGFFEFFNQRRRWTPSTIANIMDLLGNADATTRKNANMSLLYIVYQWLLMLMTVLGPGTIIMMIAGASKLVFKFTLVEAYIFAIVPAAFYTFVCFWFRSEIQLVFAVVLSVVYAFIMMIVLVGTIITATTESPFHPSVIVIVVLMMIFVIAGLCHPQEIWCLLHGVLYMITIPTGYLLLVIYSICNLNNVSWGTREVPTKAQRQEAEKKKKEKEEQKKNKEKKGFMAKIFNRGEENIRELTKLVKSLVPQKSSSAPNQPQDRTTSALVGDVAASNAVVRVLVGIDDKLKRLLDKHGGIQPSSDDLSSVLVEQPPSTRQDPEETIPKQIIVEQLATETKKKPLEKPAKGAWKKQLWIKDHSLGRGPKFRGNKGEMKFWEEFITKYLRPIRPSADEKKKMESELLDLRNKSAFAMILVNLLWMAVNFMFQLTNAARFTIYYGYHGKEKIEESVLGLAFVFLLVLLLVIQLFGMLAHRLVTFMDLMAITQINIFKRQEGSITDRLLNREETIRKIRYVLRLPLKTDPGAKTEAPTIQTVVGIGRSLKGTRTQDSSVVTIIKRYGETVKNFSVTPDTRIGKNIENDLSEPIKPRLPPRNQHFRMTLNAQHVTLEQAKLLNISTGEEGASRQEEGGGALSRTLKHRFREIELHQQQSRKNSLLESGR